MIDAIMALFPLVSSIMLMLNVGSVWWDKKVFGVSSIALAFFTSYAGWMVFYFYHIDAVIPMWTALSNFVANGAYFSSVIYFKRKQR